MSRFLPTALAPRADADRHYESVHHRFAMRMFRDHAPSVVRYATNHAIAQRDLAGTFAQRPDAWRFVILALEDPPATEGAGGKEWLPPWAEHAIVTDHTNFLREVRPFEVQPEVLLDRREGQLTTAKYLIEVESASGDRRAAEELADELCGALRDEAFGLRSVVANRVLREAAMEAVREPGQAYAGRYLDSTSMVTIVELYSDHRVWAEERLGAPELAPLLRARPDVRVGVYAVEELVGVDRR